MLKKIGLARECESPENPGELEKRVALFPQEIKKLIDAGAEVQVEKNAGIKLGIEDSEYESMGAKIVDFEELYQDKDLVIKFKGPSLESIPLMQPGTVLFCMAHFHSYPDRAKLLEKHQINVIAMEFVEYTSDPTTDDELIGKHAANALLDEAIDSNSLLERDVAFVGFSELIMGAMRRAANLNPKSVTLYPENEQANAKINSKTNPSQIILSQETEIESNFNLKKYKTEKGKLTLEYAKMVQREPKRLFRKIQCLHETGQAGAQYGLDLFLQQHPEKKSSDIKVVVIGYGNVAAGAIDQVLSQNVHSVKVLSRRHSHISEIDEFIKDADVIVNGAELPVALRGKLYLITSEHRKNLLKKGTVVIDLVGGSATNRSPVEDVIQCTFLTEPHFELDGISFAALWGWPMMGFEKESAAKYSKQILDILLGEDRLVEGLDSLSASVKPALVCGPF
ncbi:MAG: alanine dehydrogenase [Halobacteriovoraceae bacterium]|nr:alanine dehydrogenase [Halobacteriovoraceae bacterium]|tara:strand:+ start:1705 stop:3060 length:1356 start_codon:yes stop_codon:yes gene_type:complete